MLIFGMRALIEMHLDWVVVKLDIKNAQNKIKRARVLQRLLASESLRSLAPLFWACYSHRSDILLSAPGTPCADFGSEEGVQQGDSFAATGFCVGIHPEICALDAAVSQHGGAARFIMDDGYVAGPSHVVFQAISVFAAAIPGAGLELQESKTFCYSPNGGLEQDPHRRTHLPFGRAQLSSGESRAWHYRRRSSSETKIS